MGEIADEHFEELRRSGGLYIDNDGYQLEPPSEGWNNAGGINGWFERARIRNQYSCKFCNHKIGFLNRKAYNLDGSAHLCLSRNKT